MGAWFKSPRDGACCDCQPEVCDPCECLDGVIYYKTRSASLSKCGFPEFSGHVSTPPKIYRTKTLAGSIDYRFYLGNDCDPFDGCSTRAVLTYSGAMTYPRTTCETPAAANLNSDTWAPCDTPEGDIDLDVDNINAADAGNTSEGFSSTVRTITGLGCDGGSGPSNYASGSCTETLSAEYTTAQLIDDTAAVLVAQSYGGFSTTPTSFLFDLSTDETTCTIRDMFVEVRFRVPDGDCYKFKWRTTFYPRGGGAPTEINFDIAFQWDGIVPPGYNVDDPDTWPKFVAGAFTFTEFQSIFPDLPSGTVVFAAYDFECTGCEE